MSTPARELEPSSQDGSIWANRDFMRLWVAQALSQTAQNAVWFGILVLVQARSGSSIHMSIAIITLILPSILFGVIAGVYVDRWDKRWVLIGSNFLRVFVVMGYIFLGGWLGLVYVVNFVFATISQFFAPAEVSFIPSVVRRRQLIHANSLFHITFTGSQLGGLVILGPLVVSLAGLEGLFIVVAVLFATSAAVVWPLPSLSPGTRADAGIRAVEGVLGDVKEVLRFFRSDPLVSLSVVHWIMGTVLAVVIAMLAPGFVVNVLGLQAEDSVFVLAPAGLGMLAATLFLSRYAVRLNKQAVINTGLLVIAVAISLMAVLDDVWRLLFFDPALPETVIANRASLIGALMVVALVAGFAFISIIVPAQTTLQERAPVAVRGRVFAIALMLGNVISIMPLLFLGALADIIGVDRTLLVLGVLVLGVAAASAWASPRALLAAGLSQGRAPHG